MTVFSPVSLLWPILLFGATALGLAASVLWGLRHRWWRVVTSGLLAVVLAISGGLAVANIRFDYYRTWGDLLFGPHGRDVAPKGTSLDQLLALAPQVAPQARASDGAQPGSPIPSPTISISPKARRVVAGAVRNGHGLLVAVNIPGPAAHIRTRGAWLYLPAAYFEVPARPSFPVLELLHGVPGGPGTWLTVLHVQDDLDRLIAAHQMPPVIVIMPTDNPSRLRSQECEDSALALDETYLTTDVRTWAAHTLPRASRGRWGVGGYSTGAFCGYLFLLHHPQDYAAAAGVDGYYHAIDTLFARGLYRSSAERLADSPDWLWQHAPPTVPVQMLIMQGTRDEDYGHAQGFRRELLALHPPNLTLVSIDNPGAEHTARSWRRFDPLLVTWLARTLTANSSPHQPGATFAPLPLGTLAISPLSIGPDVLVTTRAAAPTPTGRPTAASCSPATLRPSNTPTPASTPSASASASASALPSRRTAPARSPRAPTCTAKHRTNRHHRR